MVIKNQNNLMSKPDELLNEPDFTPLVEKTLTLLYGEPYIYNSIYRKCYLSPRKVLNEALLEAWNTRTTPSPDPDIAKSEAGMVAMGFKPVNETPTPRTYKDVSGNPCSLDWLAKNEPEWAANQIRHRDKLERELIELRRLADKVSLDCDFLIGAKHDGRCEYSDKVDEGCYICRAADQNRMPSIIENLSAYKLFLARHPEMGEMENHGKLE